MERKDSDFIFLGNDECLDFINTEITERGKTIDLISSYENLVGWFSEMDYIDPGTQSRLLENDEEDRLEILERVKTFRSYLKHVVDTIVSGKPLRHSFLEPINEALKRGVSYNKIILINSEARLISHSAAIEFDPLAALAGAAASLLTVKDLKLTRRCEGKDCELYFYDESKNRARRWCSMNRCGNRMKAALHYRKKKAELEGTAEL